MQRKANVRGFGELVPVCPMDLLGVGYPLIYHDHHREGDPLFPMSIMFLESAQEWPAARRRTFIHSNTTDCGADVEPSASSSLSKLSIMVMGIARNADGRAGILTNLSDFPALKAHRDIFSSHNSDTVFSHLLILALNHGECTSAATKDSTALRM